jgi:integrase/recombinase XerD
MRRASKLHLPYADWPHDDRIRWEAAFKVGVDRFDDCGPAAHLAEPTRLGLRDGHARFLAFLSAHDSNLLARSPAARINREVVEAYVRSFSCGGITTVTNLHRLRDTLRFICPDEDWSWLLTIIKRISAQARPKPKMHHMVTSEALYPLGIKLMDRAVTDLIAAESTSKARAFAYRDGLMIALLALIPLRLRTLGALRIGKHLVQSGNLWALDIPAEDNKTKRPLEFPISAELSGRIDLYLNQFRCRILGAGTHDHLWASDQGRAMHDGTIYNMITRRTREALGFPVNPHRFRRAAATFWSSRDPANVRGVKDLLGHASFNTTEKHYIMAQSRVAGRALARVIQDKRKGAAVGRTLRPRASN